MERLQSQRYRWEDAELLDSKKPGKQQIMAQTPGADYIMLRQRVAQTLDTTGWGTILVMADVTLSVLSVIIYIALTYHSSNALYHLDLALACIFSLNWIFWFWVAEDRLRYVFSLLTFVDIVTIAPSFILYGLGSAVAETVPGLNFLRVLRILRVLRVFRMKNIMQRHIEGAVVEAAGKLIFSLISIIFIAAGLFYELEKYGPVDDEKHTKDLQFHQSIYWAAVTLTTVGYGDIVPTYWATQVMLIGLLMLTFTLLPYLTGNLMSALTSTSTYQRRSFKASRRPDVSHVVITGFLDGATVAGLLDELYHEDKGFNHNYAVLLSEQPPSLDVQHVLATHPASKKLTYLQGSPFRPADLWRAAPEYASAYFIMAPKYPEEPTLADRHLSMCVLSLGQYLQEKHSLLQDRLKSLPERVTHWVQHGTVVPPGRLPAVYLQVCLPEGRLRLFQVIQSLQDSRLPMHVAIKAAARAAGLDTGAAAEDAAAAAEAAEDAEEEAAAGEFDTLGGSRISRWRPEPGDADQNSAFAAAAAAATGTTGAAAQGIPQGAAAQSDMGRNGDARVDLSAYQALSPPSGTSSKSFARGSLQQQQQQQGKGVWAWWMQSLKLCLGSCCTSEPPASYKPLPTGPAFWEEFSGSIHLLCLSEIKYAMMAQSVVGVPGVMTLLCNLSTTVDFGLEVMQEPSNLPPWLRDYMGGAGQEIYKLRKFPPTLVGRSVKEAAGFLFDSCHAVLLAVEPTKGLLSHRMIVGDLQQVITSDMRGYIIADDVSAVLLASAAQEGDFELWNKLRQQHLKDQLAGISSSGTAGPGNLRGSSGGSTAGPGKQRGLWSSSGGGGGSGSKKQGGLGLSKSSGGGKAAQPTHLGAALVKSSSLVLHGTQPQQPLATQVQQRWSGTAPGSIMGVTSDTNLHGASYTDASPGFEQQRAAAAEATSSSSLFTRHPPSDMRDTAAELSATLQSVAAAYAAVGITRRVAAGHASALGALVHLLRSPSRVLRSQGQAFLREHYHMRREGSVQLPSFIEGRDHKGRDMNLSKLSGHILLLGAPTSTDGLLALLAVLRSKRLLQWRPVVIIDSNAPSGGGSWEAVAQFKDVYFVQATDGLNDALLRASAERASQAILMTPLITQEFENEDQRLASKVMIDAMVVNRYQLLKSINPDIEMVSEMMLTQNMAYLAPTVPVHGVQHKYMHLLSPAYISGSVFHARQLDDLMTASYCNGASDRIVLQLLHRWHMGWAGVQAFSSLAREQQELMPSHHQMLQSHGRVDGPHQQQQWRDRKETYQALKQQQQQQQDGRQQQDQQAHTPSTHGPLGSDRLAIAQGARERQLKRFKLAATAVLSQMSKAAGPKVAQGTAAAIAARAAEKHGVPTLMQIPVECPPGTTYGRYFHLLLHTRGLLLLGVYRHVPVGGPHFRAVITNPSYHSALQPDDHAFVVARLPLPADCSDSAAVAAAWPPDTLGFGHLHHTTPRQPDLLVPPSVPPSVPQQRSSSSRDQAQQGTGGTTLHAWGLPDSSSPTGAGPQSYQLNMQGLGDSVSSSGAMPAAAQQPQQQPVGRSLLASDSGFMPPTRRSAEVDDDGFVTAQAGQRVPSGVPTQSQAQSSGVGQRNVSVSSTGVQGALLFPGQQQQQQGAPAAAARQLFPNGVSS